MSAMMDAVKAKRGADFGDIGQGQGMLTQSDAQPKTDLKALVAALSGDEKQELMGLLSDDSAGQGGDASQIAKGAPSDQERSKISEKMASEDDDSQGADADDESDEIGMSLLSSNDKAQAGVDRPSRSLGDRVRMNMASKLKAKGKL